jgi:hypothetical protein
MPRFLTSVVLAAAFTPLAANAMTAPPLAPMQIQVHKAIFSPPQNDQLVAAHFDAAAAQRQTGQTEQTVVRNPTSFSRKVLLALALAIVLPLVTQACSVDVPPPTVDPITPDGG